MTVNGDFVRQIDERGIPMGLALGVAQLAGEKLVRFSLNGSKYDWALFRYETTREQKGGEREGERE